MALQCIFCVEDEVAGQVDEGCAVFLFLHLFLSSYSFVLSGRLALGNCRGQEEKKRKRKKSMRKTKQRKRRKKKKKEKKKRK